MEMEHYLKCLNCMQRYDVPKTLPCSCHICEQCEKRLMHVEKRDLNSNTLSYIECPICKEPQQRPKNGFPIDMLIQSLLTLKFTKNDSNLLSQCDTALKELDIGLKTIKPQIDGCGTAVKARLESLYMEIQVITLNKTNEIQRASKKVLNELKEKDDGYFKRVAKDSTDTMDTYKSVLKFVNDLTVEYDKWKLKVANCAGVDTEQLKKIMDEAIWSLSRLKKKEAFLKDSQSYFEKLCIDENKLELCADAGRETLGPAKCVKINIDCLKEQIPFIIDFQDKVKDAVKVLLAEIPNTTDIVIAVNKPFSLLNHMSVQLIVYDVAERKIKLNCVLDDYFQQTCEQIDLDGNDMSFKLEYDVFLHAILCLNDTILIGTHTNIHEVLQLSVDLKLIRRVQVGREISALFAHKNGICVLNVNEPFISVYDEAFEFVRSFGQKTDSNGSFYIQTTQNLKVHNDYIYVMHNSSSLTILSMTSGRTMARHVLRNTSIDDFTIISNDFIVFWNSSLLHVYDSNVKTCFGTYALKCVKSVKSLRLLKSQYLIVSDENKRACVFKV